MPPCIGTHALVVGFDSAAQHELKRSPGIIHKSRVLYPGSRFLSSTT